MGFDLRWMPPQAPYMPVVVVGLLDLLEEAGHAAAANWRDDQRQVLTIDVPLNLEEAGTVIASADRPSLDRIDWPDGSHGQGLKPTLRTRKRPARAFRTLVETAPGLEKRLLRAVLTDAVLDGDGLPTRSCLLRGVKADLSIVAAQPEHVDAESLTTELREGPRFRGRKSGRGLGLVPEVQAFGGPTGRDPSDVGAYSPLLYLLLWRGLLAMPPVAIGRGGRRVVGGPLVTDATFSDSYVLSWPRWQVPVRLNALRSLMAWREVHQRRPDQQQLSARGIDAVYRVRGFRPPHSKEMPVFRWGERVAG